MIARWIVAPFFTAGLSAALPEVVDFNDHVQPILSENCYHCHGPDPSTREPKKAPLRIDREEYAFRVRPDGRPAIVRGDAAASELVRRITTADPDGVMPPPESHRNPLSPGEVAIIEKWIEQGAPYEEHWAFVKPLRPRVPESDWGNNPIDSYIAAGHRAQGLRPNGPAPAHRLIRRLALDLTGLPPSPGEVAIFENAAAHDFASAVEMAVSRLIGTDAYAEHFARHWLDVARYADTQGLHFDNYRSIWPYRDWVIDSIRRNQPFDQFTIEQIAGDLLPDATLEQTIATGFHRCLPTSSEGGIIPKEYEAIHARDRVETTTAAWLGLTAGCAGCHDHKFDPISQRDFYSLAAYFRNATTPAVDGRTAVVAPTVFATRIEDRGRLAAIGGEVEEIDAAMALRREGARGDFRSWFAAGEDLPADRRSEGEREAIYQYYLTAVDPPSRELQARKDALVAERERLRSRGAATLVMGEKGGDAFAHVLGRGDYRAEKEKVFADIPALFRNGAGAKRDGRQSRRDLAEWLVSPDNPLTARVTVNRIWYYFFGRGLVETTEDFGVMGARPTHPELLDYLAVEFVESGWDLRHVIRLVTTSATYHQSGMVTAAHREKDPANLYLARHPRHRLDAEQIRDMALAASGLLVAEVGGPPVRPYQPEGVWKAVELSGSDTGLYAQDSGENLYRRSIYTFWKRVAPPPAMEIFDAPKREVFCVRRGQTNTPLQALVTLNDTQFVEAYRHLATLAIKASPGFDGRLDHITRTCLGRTLDDEERQIVRRTHSELAAGYAAAPELAAELVSVGDSAPDPSIAAVDLAPWTLVASQIFNLDETLTR